MTDLEIIILAAGKGTRMNSEEPKVLTALNGKPMLSYLLKTTEKVSKKPIIVLGYKADHVKAKIGPNERYVLQGEQLGTGHAVNEAISHISPKAKYVIVFYGDHPLITPETITRLYESHINQALSPLTLVTITVPDFLEWREPFYNYGRIIRNTEGKILKNMEKKDASASELEIKEVSPAFFCFNVDWLTQNIKKIGKKNAQGEYYLTDLIGMARDQGYELNSITIPTHEALGINTQAQLELVTKFIK